MEHRRMGATRSAVDEAASQATVFGPMLRAGADGWPCRLVRCAAVLRRDRAIAVFRPRERPDDRERSDRNRRPSRAHAARFVALAADRSPIGSAHGPCSGVDDCPRRCQRGGPRRRRERRNEVSSRRRWDDGAQGQRSQNASRSAGGQSTATQRAQQHYQRQKAKRWQRLRRC